MKKKMKYLIAGIVMAMALFMIAGCGTSDDSESFSGVLNEASHGKIVVENDSDIMEFATTNETVYDFGDENHLSIGDTIDVEYHADGSDKIADTITITEAKPEDKVLEGEVINLSQSTFTLTSDNLTATFSYDADTEIEGDLTDGDQAEVTYQGDLNKLPHANKIVVTKEKKDAKTDEIAGNVGDISSTSILLSIDSAAAHRFVINSDTKVTGKDGKAEIGDRVVLTYTGELDKSPVAVSIKIVRKDSKDKHDKDVINGKIIKKDGKKSFQINTGKHKYTFLENDKTAFSGKSLETGRMATVTYTGDLNKKPLATAVYCSGKADPKPKPTTKATTAEPTTEEPTTKETTTEETTTEETTTEEPTEEPTTEAPTTEEPTTEAPEPEPQPIPIRGTGIIDSWSSSECTVHIEGAGSVKLHVTSESEISSGYLPEAGDKVMVTYDKNNMNLLKIELLSRPNPSSDSSSDEDSDE